MYISPENGLTFFFPSFFIHFLHKWFAFLIPKQIQNNKNINRMLKYFCVCEVNSSSTFFVTRNKIHEIFLFVRMKTEGKNFLAFFRLFLIVFLQELIPFTHKTHSIEGIDVEQLIKELMFFVPTPTSFLLFGCPSLCWSSFNWGWFFLWTIVQINFWRHKNVKL